MRLIISNTGPINYLVLIGRVNTLPALSEKVLIPSVVREELSNPKTPSAVREWIAHPPAWLEVRQPLVHSFDDDLLSSLGEGERAAIKLVTTTLRANTLLLMDDPAAVHVARRIGLTVTGTIGVLEEAAQRGLLDPAVRTRARRQPNP